MKTYKNLIIIILITLSLSAFTLMKPENVYNSNHNFGINDTIDTLGFDDEDLFKSVSDDDLENANKDLENANKDLENANKDLENANKINNAVHSITDSLNSIRSKK